MGIIITPDLRAVKNRVMRKRYKTIREFAEALLRIVLYQDEDGRNIGYDYEAVRKRVLHKFPVVRMTAKGGGAAYSGKPTKMPYKEFSRMCMEMKTRDPSIRLPFRIRRHRSSDNQKELSKRRLTVD
jgi:hypothetical protein